jgi:hypothetical protein
MGIQSVFFFLAIISIGNEKMIVPVRGKCVSMWTAFLYLQIEYVLSIDIHTIVDENEVASRINLRALLAAWFERVSNLERTIEKYFPY